MTGAKETIKKIEDQILRSDATICRHIDYLDSAGRGAVSQDILSNLRTFVEHVMLRTYANSYAIAHGDSVYEQIKEAITFVKQKGQLKFLWKFHAYLQIVVSHYTLEPEDSERVMLKYYEFMLRVKAFLKTQYDLEVLANLDNYPLNTDKNLQEYYEKIADSLNHNSRMRCYKLRKIWTAIYSKG